MRRESGTRPLVGGSQPLLALHPVDFAGDLYGRELEVISSLRPAGDELRFDIVPEMVERMHWRCRGKRVTRAHGCGAVMRMRASGDTRGT